MTRKSKEGAIQDIVNALLDSEIPEISSVANELAECTKLLEEHGHKLRGYANEIQGLASNKAESLTEVPTEVSLTERLKELERTLAELSQKATGRQSAAETRVESSRGLREEPREEPGEEPGEEVRETPVSKPKAGTFTTPEGFVVKRGRH